MVSTGPRGSPEFTRAGFLRMERYGQKIQWRPHHFHGHGKIELDVGSRRQRVLLAPFFLSSTRFELRQSRGSRTCDLGDEVLAGYGSGRIEAGRDSLSCRTGGYELRKPA